MPRVKILPHELKGLSAEAEARITAELRKPLIGRKPRAKRGTGKVGQRKRKLNAIRYYSPLASQFMGLVGRGELEGVGGGIVEEWRFDHSRRWRFDFAWVGRKVAVELEGGVYSGGRHTRGKGFEGDCEKYNRAASLGWVVLRYTIGMLKRPDPLADLRAVLEAKW